jgi:hypothetical protein
MSQYQTLKDIIYESGTAHLFQFSDHEMRIVCKTNGNMFVSAGCDDVMKIKSIKDPTGAWYEEDIISEADFITITSSIRTTKADYLQEIFTINPEVEGDYEDNWFWKRFFAGHGSKSFRSITEVNIKIGNAQKTIELPYTTHHSTYKDNRWLPLEFAAILESLRDSNPYYYTIYTLGEWGNKIVGGRAYAAFEMSRNTRPLEYRPELPLHISFDFNVWPYMSMVIAQGHGNELHIIDTIRAEEPHNNTKGICRIFHYLYGGHDAGLYLYGDPSGRAKDTRTERGTNDFTIIKGALRRMRPKDKVMLKAPAVSSRIDFINEIFRGNTTCSIKVNNNGDCRPLTNDLLYTKEAPDGTKFKETVKDDDTGIRYQKYGHFTDAMDYLVIKYFSSEYTKWIRGGKPIVTTVGGERRSVIRKK